MTDFRITLARAGLVATCRGLLSLRSRNLPAPAANPRIYVANHVSHADFVALWTALPPELRLKTRPVAGADYWQASRLRHWLITHVFRGVLVTRGAANASEPAPDPIPGLAAPLQQGEDLIFFPEGTRNLTDAALLPLRSGIYRLMKAVPEAEVVPLWITHMDRILPKGAILPVPLNCTLTFGAPLRLTEGESGPAFLDRLHKAILACNEAPT